MNDTSASVSVIALAALALAACSPSAPAPAEPAPAPEAAAPAEPAAAPAPEVSQLPAGVYTTDPSHSTLIFHVGHLGCRPSIISRQSAFIEGSFITPFIYLHFEFSNS